jgi:tRNA modification GTPase
LLREGYRVVIAGPPNLGKSTLFNALVESEAAITTPIAGTTRDVLTRPVSLEGIPFLFADTAGLHDAIGDEVEAIGIERALEALDRADLVLWLGPEQMGPEGAWEIASQIDREDSLTKRSARHRISAKTGAGMEALRKDLIATARAAMPAPGEAALNGRQHRLLTASTRALGDARHETDPLLVAEALRQARVAFDALLGRAATEDMLDALFGRFCIGK